MPTHRITDPDGPERMIMTENGTEQHATAAHQGTCASECSICGEAITTVEIDGGFLSRMESALLLIITGQVIVRGRVKIIQSNASITGPEARP